MDRFASRMERLKQRRDQTRACHHCISKLIQIISIEMLIHRGSHCCNVLVHVARYKVKK